MLLPNLARTRICPAFLNGDGEYDVDTSLTYSPACICTPILVVIAGCHDQAFPITCVARIKIAITGSAISIDFDLVVMKELFDEDLLGDLAGAFDNIFQSLLLHKFIEVNYSIVCVYFTKPVCQTFVYEVMKLVSYTSDLLYIFKSQYTIF